MDRLGARFEGEDPRALGFRLRAIRSPGSYAEALAVAADAVAALEPGGATPSLAVALIELGWRHDDLGETEAAERRFREAAFVAGTVPRGEAIRAEALARWAATAQFLGRVADGRRLADEAVAVIDAIPDTPPEIVAEVLVEAARVGLERSDAVVGRLLDRASAAAEAVPEGRDRDEARMRPRRSCDLRSTGSRMRSVPTITSWPPRSTTSRRSSRSGVRSTRRRRCTSGPSRSRSGRSAHRRRPSRQA